MRLGILKILLFFLAAMPALFLSASAYAFNPLNQACTGVTGSSVCADSKNTADPVAGPTGIIKKASNLIAIIAGIGAVVMMILGGLGYVTAGGSAEGAAKARARILAGLVGLIVVALAWAIVGLVVTKVIR